MLRPEYLRRLVDEAHVELHLSAVDPFAGLRIGDRMSKLDDLVDAST